MKTFKEFLSEGPFISDHKDLNDKYASLHLNDEGIKPDPVIISQALRNRHAEEVPESKERSENLKKYTDHNERSNVPKSTALNKRLIAGKKLSTEQQKVHDAIHASKHSPGDHLHLFSGTKTDFGALAKESKDGILHSAAHISATHSPKTALGFAGKKADNRHILHVHVQPHDKIVHMSGHSHWRSEHESIVPSGTKLKYSHTTEHSDGYGGTPVKVHHFTIHSQD